MNEKVNLAGIKGLKMNNNSFTSRSKTEASEVFYYDDGSKAYVFNSDNDPNNSYVIKVSASNELLTEKNLIILNSSGQDNKNITIEVINSAGDKYTVDVLNGIIQSTQSSSRQLFSDCFVSSWAYLGNDFVGLLAEITEPVACAIACAIHCA